jgi:hypothetical protein
MNKKKRSKQQGDGFISDLIDKFLPTRKQFPPKTRNNIAKYADKTIKSAIVGRFPVQSYVTKILNVLSLGAYKEQLKKMNYDDVFHLFSIFTLDDGTNMLVEKNQVIRIMPVPPSFLNKATNTINVPINKKITFGELIKNTVEKIGESLYLYDHVNNNCQIFLMNILTANGLITPEIRNFIMQDVEKLLSTSPQYVNMIARFATEAGAKVDRLIEGEGRKRKQTTKQPIKRTIKRTIKRK